MDLQPMQFSGGGRDYVIEPDPVWPRAVQATPVGNKKPVGRLAWHRDDIDDGMGNKVQSVFVHEKHRRRGLATAMWEQAKQMNPNIQHSHARTEDGRAWSAKVGD